MERLRIIGACRGFNRSVCAAPPSGAAFFCFLGENIFPKLQQQVGHPPLGSSLVDSVDFLLEDFIRGSV
ncbi:hypothetical protein, partial [Eubacterium pyruvativorans]|uniref:hypothetical protein n=1 Tax=Eubacterium pyruvativorans TaxID=155865 RepID=UPI0023F31716